MGCKVNHYVLKIKVIVTGGAFTDQIPNESSGKVPIVVYIEIPMYTAVSYTHLDVYKRQHIEHTHIYT